MALSGNDYFIFRSALFWFSIPIAFFLCLLPRFLAKTIQTQFWPTDIDILKELRRTHPEIDMQHHHSLGGRSLARDTVSTSDSQHSSGVPSRLHGDPPQALGCSRPSMEAAGRSVTDMSLGGVQSTHRGFDFASEEGGVHIRRIQSNLSERRLRTLGDGKPSEEGERPRRRPSISLFPNLRRSVRRRMRPQSPKQPNFSQPTSRPT